MNISAAGEYDATNGNTLIGGTFTNSGTITPRTGTFVINGTSTWDGSGLVVNDLDLNGNKLTMEDNVTVGGTFTSGTTSEIEITNGVSWVIDENTTLARLWNNGSLDIAAGKVLTFTTTGGFENSTGYINVTGSLGNLASITGPANWTINASAMNSAYWWVYANITNGYNFGSGQNGSIVLLGDITTCYPSARWDNSPPAITSYFLSEGYDQNIYDNSTLILDWLAQDMVFLNSMNWTLICTDNNTVMAQGNISLITNYTASYRHNESIDISDQAIWAPGGSYIIFLNASDSHNPTYKAGRKRAEDMLVNVEGMTIGKKAAAKKMKDTEGHTVHFKKANPIERELYTIEILDKKKNEVKNSITYSDIYGNFKLTHLVKMEQMHNFIRMRITAEKIIVMRGSPYAMHLLIMGYGDSEYLYYWDAVDHYATGGMCRIEKELESEVIIKFFHPDYLLDIDKQRWVEIDPMSSSINSNSISFNFTLSYSVPETDDSSHRAKVIEQQEEDDRMAAPVIIGSLFAIKLTLLLGYLSTREKRKGTK